MGVEFLELGTCQSYKFDQESSGPPVLWQLANRVNGDKDQRFVEAAFDDQGGLWVAGRAGYQPHANPITI